MTDRPQYLVCSAVAGSRLADIVEGSQLTNCALCDAPLWIAPSGRAMVEDDPAIVKICIDCLRPLAEAANTINVSKPPGAPEEWLRHTTYRQNRQN